MGRGWQVKIYPYKQHGKGAKGSRFAVVLMQGAKLLPMMKGGITS